MYSNYSIARQNDSCSEAHIFKSFNAKLLNRSLKIMIIDDNKRDIQLFEDLLLLDSTLNFSLSKWTNSHDALDALEHEKLLPDLIVLDLVMPCMNGKMILKRLKALPTLSAIPVVIHSSMNNYENILKISDLDAHAFFSKPINAELFESFLLEQII